MAKKKVEASADHAGLVEKLVEFNYMNFDRRRSYEWKVSLGLWTALAAFIALSLEKKITMELPVAAILLMVIIAALVIGVQIYFLIMICLANEVDKEISRYYQRALNVPLKTDWDSQDDEESKKIRVMITSFKGKKCRLGGFWAVIVQVGITILLLLTIPVVLIGNTKAKSENTAGMCCQEPVVENDGNGHMVCIYASTPPAVDPNVKSVTTPAATKTQTTSPPVTTASNSNKTAQQQDYQQKLVEAKLESFENRVNDLKWIITTALSAMGVVIAVMGASLGYVTFKQSREYKEAVIKAEEAAKNAERWEEKARDKYDSIDKQARERIGDFDKKAGEKFTQLDKKAKEHLTELFDEAEKQRATSQKWSEAFRAVATGDQDKACSLWEEIIRQSPKNHNAYNNWGVSLLRLGNLGGPDAAARFNDACQKFEKAIEIKNDYHHAYFNWGTTLTGLGKLGGPDAAARFKDACQKYEKAIEIKNDYHEACDGWGYSLFELGKLGGPDATARFKEAETILLKGEALKKGSCSYNLACVYARLGDDQRCHQWLITCQEAHTLPTLKHAENDADLESVREKDWFKAINWKVEE